MKFEDGTGAGPKRGGGAREYVCREQASVTRATGAAAKLTAGTESNSVQTM
jgi:hypothetical protein